MARRRPGETDRAYVARLRAVIAAARRPEPEAPTPEEEIQWASLLVESGAAYGYMAGSRLADYQRIERIARDLEDARRLAVPDLDDRTAEAVRAAWAVAEPWRGWWE